MAGNFITVRPFTYVAGTIIDPDENNPNENTIYNKHNAAFNNVTGHQHTGAVGDAPKIGASGLDLGGNYAWTGTHTWATNLAWYSGTAFLGTFDHANTANRVYTFPDTDGTVVLTTTIGALLVGIDHGGLVGLGDDDHTQYILVNGSRAFTGDQSLGGFSLTNVNDPVNPQDAATKAYVDTNFLPAAGASGATGLVSAWAFYQDVPLGAGDGAIIDSFGISSISDGAGDDGYYTITTSFNFSNTGFAVAGTTINGTAADEVFFEEADWATVPRAVNSFGICLEDNSTSAGEDGDFSVICIGRRA